jgi:hypothetical protein
MTPEQGYILRPCMPGTKHISNCVVVLASTEAVEQRISVHSICQHMWTTEPHALCVFLGFACLGTLSADAHVRSQILLYIYIYIYSYPVL